MHNPRLVQKDDRLDGFELREERPEGTAVAPPVVERLERRRCHARVSGAPPVGDAIAHEVHELQLDADAVGRALLRFVARLAVEVVAGRRPGVGSVGAAPSSRCQCLSGSSNGEQMIGCGTSNSLIGIPGVDASLYLLR